MDIEVIRLKGDITLYTIFEGLLIIGLIIIILYFASYSRIMITINLDESSREREAINLANGLISHEKLVYEKNDVRYRGILDAKKLDNLFYKSYYGLKDLEEFRKVILNPSFTKGKLSREELDLGYSQLIGIVYVVDLDECNEDKCIVWTAVLLPVYSISDWVMDNPGFKFLKCLYDSFDGNWVRPGATCLGFAATGAAVGFFIGGPAGSAVGAGVGCLAGFLSNIFSLGEIEYCLRRADINFNTIHISELITERQGLPINIIYEDGRIHVGRIIVGLIEWL